MEQPKHNSSLPFFVECINKLHLGIAPLGSSHNNKQLGLTERADGSISQVRAGSLAVFNACRKEMLQRPVGALHKGLQQQ